MYTKEQLRAARGLLEVSQTFVAKTLETDQRNISNLEKGNGEATGSNVPALVQFYQSRGIEFTDYSGVRFQPSGTRLYRGNSEFREFYDKLYETARIVGGDICLCNAVSHLVIGALGENFVKRQQERMEKIKNNYRYRVIFGEGDDVFFGSDYCEYRWIPTKFFNKTALFIFGDTVAFANFANNDVEVVAIENANAADTQRHFFNFFWEIASEPKA